MADIMQLQEWFKRDIPFANWKKNVQVLEASDSHLHIRIFTENNSYSINARSDRNYLGCVASSRKPRAGETWTRGNDLPDGELTEQTWQHILAAIVGYELVKLNIQTEYGATPDIPSGAETDNAGELPSPTK